MDGRTFLASAGAAQVATLLRLRRELGHPAPHSLGELAARLDRPYVTAQGLVPLDKFHCTLAEAVAAFGPTTAGVLAEVVGVEPDAPGLTAALDQLTARGM